MTVLIVGGGKMGLSHLALASRMLGRDSVALCDASFPLRFFYRSLSYRTFASLDAAFEKLGGQLRAAIVATPTPSHYPIARTLLQKSVPCFIEKPLTLNPRHSSELLEAASAHNLHVQVGFVLRYVTTFAQLRELAASGRLGRPLSYTARMSGNVITGTPTDSWRSDFSRGGGCLNEYGPHLIDLCRYAFGDISDISAAAAAQVYSKKADDRLSLTWTHSSSVQGRLELDWCDSSRRKSVVQFDVSFERGRVVLDNSALRLHDVPPGGPGADAGSGGHFAKPPSVTFYLRGEEYSLQLEEFFRRSLGRDIGVPPFGGSATPALLEDGLEVDRLIETVARKAGLA